MFYEWRTYEAMPGKMPALNTHLKAAAKAFAAGGLGTLGFWTEDDATLLQISYAWIYESLDDKAAKIRAFAKNQEWLDHLARERATEGQIVAGVQSTLWSPTRYFPEPKVAGAIQELRIYDAAPGKLDALHKRFADNTIDLFKKHGMENVGYWTETFGYSNRLIYMLGHASVAARQASWAAFGADPAWQSARAESEKDGSLVANMTNRLLRPTEWSGR